MEPEWSRCLRELTLEITPLVGDERDKAACAIQREITKRGIEINRLRDALRGLLAIHEGPCRLDHEGYCQEHGLSRPCAAAAGWAALGEGR